ncbi:MAG: glutamate-cysteine ligase family protein, partial [Candidatus Omnitrophica bacterium]|nr:glutamate-cysteine ligase family protein [Candidatus Omnitrophota bacterium]
MSTFLGEKQSTELRSEEDLSHYFESFAKSHDAMRVGIEVEFLGVHKATGRALPYDGPDGIHEVLKLLAKLYGYDPVLENGNIIALGREGRIVVSLEPGGQLELSAPPAINVFEVEAQIQQFLSELREVRARLPGIEWLAVGIQPFSGLGDAPMVPKHRYLIMEEYFKTHGTLSHEMMKLTATNQVNFDYLSEENAMSSLRVVLGITSIISALFSNSSFSNGRPNGFMTRRVHIWNHTDPDRTGLILPFTRSGCTFKDYLDYVLRIPMFFIVRRGKWAPMQGVRFRDFIRNGFEGTRATLADFELHLGTVFPEARLKQYLEIRGVDCQSPGLISAVAAFWKGILYDPVTRELAWDLVSFASEEDRLRLHPEIPEKGLAAVLGTEPIFPIAQELVDLSCASLTKQKTKDEKRDECRFLCDIRQKIIKTKKS